MAKNTRFINDDRWKLIDPLLPKPKINPKGGRPSIDNREVLEGIIWVLRTGARWQDLPDRYPSASSCWRRLRLWEEQGVWLDVWRKFLSMLDEKGALDWQEAFIDGSFAPAKKGGPLLALPNGAIEAIEKNQKRRMAGNSSATGKDGKLNVLFLGCLIFAAWLYAMID